MSVRETVYLPRGYALTLTSDASSSGTYFQKGNPGSVDNAPSTQAVSTTTVIGPFNDPYIYQIESIKGQIVATQAFSGTYSGADEVNVALLAPKASPTFTGTVVLPSTTSIGTVSNTELGYVDGVTSAIQTQLNSKLPSVTVTGIGAAAAGTTAVEAGDAYQHTTILTVSTGLPAIAGGAALSIGKLLYTFPAGAIVVDKAYMSMAILSSEEHIDADTPDVGLGTVIAAGANALLSDTSGAENILTGQTANNCTGTAEVKTVADQVLVIESADNHTVYFNVADDWAADGDATAGLTGTVVLHWHKMS